MPATGDTYDVQYPVNDPDLYSQDYAKDNLPKGKLKFSASNCTKSNGFNMEFQYFILCLNFYQNTSSTYSIGKIVVTKSTETSTPHTLSCGTGVTPSKDDKNPTPFYLILPTGEYSIKVDVYDNASTPALICSFSSGEKTFSAGGSLSLAKKEIVPAEMTLGFNLGGIAMESPYAHTWDKYDAETHVSPVVTGAPEGATIVYSSSDTDQEYVVIDTSTGEITDAKKVTTTPITITATVSASGYKQTEISYALTITDSAPVDNPIVFSKGGQALVNDSDKHDFISTSTYVSPTITSESAGDRDVTYKIISQTPANLATINEENGTVTINTDSKTGTVIVEATAAASSTYTKATKTYTLNIIDSRIVLKKGETTFTDSEDTFDLINSSYTAPTFTKATGDDRTISYAKTSGDNDVAYIDASTGAVTFNTTSRKTGSVTFTVTATASAGSIYTTDSKSYTLKVIDSQIVFKKNGTELQGGKDSFDHINDPSTFVSPKVELATGDNRTLSYSIESGSDIAEVDNDGDISFKEGYKTGDVIVKATATAPAGSIYTTKDATYTLTVSDTYVPIKGVSLSKTEIVVAAGSNYTLTPTPDPSNASNVTYSWTSSDTSNKVNVTDGEVSVDSGFSGTATITCTAKGERGESVNSKCTVYTPYFEKVTSAISTDNDTYIITDVNNTVAFKGIINRDVFESTNNTQNVSTSTKESNIIIFDNQDLYNCKTNINSSGNIKFINTTGDKKYLLLFNVKEAQKAVDKTFKAEKDPKANSIEFSENEFKIYLNKKKTDKNPNKSYDITRWLTYNNSAFGLSESSSSVLLWKYVGPTE